MTIVPLLQSVVDDELARSAGLIARTLSSTLEQLKHPRDKLLSASERQHYFELVQLLQLNQALYQRSFVSALRTLVQADLHPSAEAALPQPATHTADVLALSPAVVDG